jgi:hypothetical protein
VGRGGYLRIDLSGTLPTDIRLDVLGWSDAQLQSDYVPYSIGNWYYATDSARTYGPWALDPTTNQVLAQKHWQDSTYRGAGQIHEQYWWSATATGTPTLLVERDAVYTPSETYFWPEYLLDVSGSAPVNIPCVSRIKASMPGVQVLDNAIIGLALALIPSSWWGDLLGWYLGFTLDVNALCANLPPTITQIATTALINPGHAGLDVLYATLWPYYCECTPGNGTPVPPPRPNPPKPPDWPASPDYRPDPVNPCLDISLVRELLDQILKLVQRDLELDKAVQRFSVPFGTMPGATHAGLTGSGSIDVSRLAGVLVTWTGGQPAAVWEGEPPYFKDLGWLSASDGGAMLQETRITRQQQIWMPRQMQLATTLGYFAKDGIQLALQELLPEE